MTPQETHAKNLAWIDRLREQNTMRWFNLGSWAFASEIAEKSLLANRKVLERHAPDDEFNSLCRVCCVPDNNFESYKHVPFPCPTYTDISDGLGIPNE